MNKKYNLKRCTSEKQIKAQNAGSSPAIEKDFFIEQENYSAFLFFKQNLDKDTGAKLESNPLLSELVKSVFDYAFNAGISVYKEIVDKQTRILRNSCGLK